MQLKLEYGGFKIHLEAVSNSEYGIHNELSSSDRIYGAFQMIYRLTIPLILKLLI